MKIKIDTNEKYTIKLETVKEDFEDSFFSGVYKSALDNLIEIVDASINRKNTTNNGFISIVPEEKNKDNNIIAFVGERGSGKSSTMLSFVNAIGNMNDLLNFGGHPNHEIKNYHFEFIDVIDPSLFERNDNILEIVIARMFHKFRESFSSENSNSNKDYNAKKNLLEKFEKVYKSIKTIEKNEKYSNEDELIEEIANLSTGSNLRKNIQCLVDEYLSFFNKKEHKFLVLVIDDFDLNIKHASEMAELIRKYLFIPNVIIFTALNFNDLSLLMQQDYSKSLETSLKNNQITNEEIKDKSFRYLEKFIPYPRRIFLPDISRDKNIIKLEIEGESNESNLEKEILKLIKDKTGLIFYETEGRVATLVPDTLRGIRSLVLFLLSLKEKAYKININAFERYIYDNVLTKLVPDKINDIEFIESVSFKDRNKYILKLLLGEDFYNNMKKRNLFIIDVLNFFKAYPKDKDDIRFVYALKLNYSILLNKLAFEGKNSELFLLTGKTIYSYIDFRINNDLKPYNELLFVSNSSYSRIEFLYNKFTVVNNQDISYEIDLNKPLLELLDKLFNFYNDSFRSSKEEHFELLKLYYSSINTEFSKTIENLIEKLSKNNQILYKIDSMGSFYYYLSILEDLKRKNKLSELSKSDYSKLETLILKIKTKVSLGNDLENFYTIVSKINTEKSYYKNEIIFKNNLDLEKIEYICFIFNYLIKNDKTDNFFYKLVESNTNQILYSFSNKTLSTQEIPFIELSIPEYILDINLDSKQENYNLFMSSNENLKNKFNIWINKYKVNTALPLYSLDLLEKILTTPEITYYINNPQKLNFSELFYGIIKNISNNIKNIDKSLYEAFIEHPLYKPILSSDNDILMSFLEFVFDDSMIYIE